MSDFAPEEHPHRQHPDWVRPLTAVLAVAVLGGALGGYFGVRAALGGAGGSGGAIAPSARGGAAMAYDEATGTVVLFGGEGAKGLLGDTWTWDGSAWSQQHPSTSPPARTGGLMAFDPASHGVVLVGGDRPQSNTGIGYACAVPVTVSPLAAPANRPAAIPGPAIATPASVSPPPSRYTSPPNCPTLKPRSAAAPLQDTWRWDGSNWHSLATGAPVVSAVLSQLITDPVLGSVLLLSATPFQPELGIPCPLAANAISPATCGHVDQWPAYTAYTLSGSKWKRVAAPSAAGSLPAAESSLAFDPSSGHVSIFERQTPNIAVCGQVPTGSLAPEALPCRPTKGTALPCCDGRVAVWTGSSWRAAGEFRGGPPSVSMHGLVGDLATHSVISVAALAGPTWIWTGKWTQLHPAHSPSSSGSASAYDAKSGQVVLFGGFAGGGAVKPTTGQFEPRWTDQTWTWDGVDWTQRTGRRALTSPSSSPSQTPIAVPPVSPPGLPACPPRASPSSPAAPAQLPGCVAPG